MRVYRDLAYGPDPLQGFDLTLPAAAAGPLIVFVHGGAWISGDKSEGWPLSEKLVAEGAAFASLNYRLSPQIRFPAHVEDVARGCAKCSSSTADSGFRVEQLILAGHSVGAHTIAMLASGDWLSELAISPSGFVGIEGIYDVPDLVWRWPAYREWFVDKAFANEADWPVGSPSRRSLTSLAPWLLIHSVQDDLVDVEQSFAFAQLLKNHVRVEVVSGEFGGHDEGIQKPGEQVVEAVRNFIR